MSNVRLRSINIKNFRCIDTLRLDFPEQIEAPEREGGPAPVLLLAGENGVGKTSVLESICVALGLNADLRGALVRLGCEDFEVSADLHPATVPAIPPQGKWLWTNAMAASARALLPHAVRDSVRYIRSSRASERALDWSAVLATRDTEPEGVKVIEFLRSFAGDTALSMSADRGKAVKVFREIESMGSGKQDLVALACEIAWAKPAICLIDLPELYMSIPWQRRIIPALREFSPGTQFIACDALAGRARQRLQLRARRAHERLIWHAARVSCAPTWPAGSA